MVVKIITTETDVTDVNGARPGTSASITVTITVRTVHGTCEYCSRHV